MSKSETEWRNLDLTTDELDRFTKAFKSDKFRRLFAEYCQEISDPENRRIYEAELKQFEAERGIDVLFITPEPGFVVKSIVNGNQKIFINVAKSEKVDKPSSQRGIDVNTGEHGLNWRLPYVQSKPKHDYDKNKVICAVFDVIFHSDTLHLAGKNPAFKRLIVETAYDAVRTTFDLALDSSKNLKFPKLAYKGTPAPVVIRRQQVNNQPVNGFGQTFVGDRKNAAHNGATATNAAATTKKCSNNNNINNINNSNKNNISTNNNINKNNKNNSNKHNGVGKQNGITIVDEYQTPTYEIIHRRHVEMHEYTDELDAKLNITIPKELVIKMHLPLLNSSKDVVLDVNSKSIYMHCDTPAKYKLNVNLPHEVDKGSGTAQFDNQSKILAITLPVLSGRKKLGILDLCREDSGVESDHHSHSPKEESLDDDVFNIDPDHYPSNKKSSEPIEPDLGACVDSPHDDDDDDDDDDDSVDDDDSFLESSINYALPHFTFNRFENIVAFTLHVKNVESNSIETLHTGNGYRLKFTTIGSGYFNNYYAFYFALPTGTATVAEQPRVETWDNNVVIQIELDSIDRFCSYDVGVSRKNCKTFICNEKKSYHERKSSVDEKPKIFVEVGTTMVDEELQIEITNKNFNAKNTNDDTAAAAETSSLTVPVPATKPAQRSKSKKSKRDSKKGRSFSESHCDDLKENENAKRESILLAQPNDSEKHECLQQSLKLRTQSESSNDEHHMDLFPLKSILKRHSSYDRTTTPECSLDDHHGCSGSIDLGIGSFKSIPEERDNADVSESVKKTVRFDKQLCRKLLFKMNSTIIGQRKPKENKRKKKKRSQERRYSEGEASDYENQLQQTSGACNNNHCVKSATAAAAAAANAAATDINKNQDAEHKNNLIFDIEI